MSRLWLVEIHENDFEYDCFVSGVVWAETPEEAERLIRDDQKPKEEWGSDGMPRGDKTRLIVKPAPSEGVVHVHWHAG